MLGPLVVGGFFCEAPDETALRGAGAADSKALSHKRRQAAKKALAELGQARVLQVTPAEIDAGNINVLEERCFLDLIVHFRPERVYIDAPVHPRGIPRFVARLQEQIRKAGLTVPTMIVEPKADHTYAIVGAASIFAKTERDAEITALGAVGSGYPSDPKTRNWLMGFIERDEAFPPCVRTRWGTIEKLRQQSLFARNATTT